MEGKGSGESEGGREGGRQLKLMKENLRKEVRE